MSSKRKSSLLISPVRKYNSRTGLANKEPRYRTHPALHYFLESLVISSTHILASVPLSGEQIIHGQEAASCEEQCQGTRQQQVI